eukprot:46062_1
MTHLSSYSIAIFILCIVNVLSKTCKLEDGSDHECPVFDDETEVKMFTAEELSQFDGVKDSKIYLAVIGEVFDVTKGKNYYGPDAGGYSGFAAKDGSRAFAIGGFTEKELVPDITDLDPSSVISIYDWMTFYRKDYIPVGKLIGLYYGEDGKATEYRKKVEELILKGYLAKKQTEDMSKKYPRCNSQSGSRVRNRVWCSDMSGGIERGWSGVPRKFMDPTLGGKGRTRCACVTMEEAGDATRFQPYDEYPCDDTATECFLEPPLKTEV